MHLLLRLSVCRSSSWNPPRTGTPLPSAAHAYPWLQLLPGAPSTYYEVKGQKYLGLSSKNVH